MSRKTYAFLCVILFYSWINPALAESTKEILSLHEALMTAYRQNPRVVQARKSVDGAEGDLLQDKSWANPEIEAEIGGLKKEDGKRDPGLGSISFKQPFDPPGVRSIEKRISQNSIIIRQEELKLIWSEVYLEVRSVYAQLILMKKEGELKEKNLNTMRQFFSDVQVRYQGGQALKNHAQRAKIEMLKAESLYMKAENDLAVNKARLNLLLGRDYNIAFEIEDQLEEETLQLNLDELMSIALTNRPEIKMQERFLGSKQMKVTQEKLNRLPSYAIGFEMIDEDYEQDYAVLFEVSLPLWSWNRGKVKKSKAERDAQEIMLEAQKSEITFEVYAAYKDARLAQQQLKLHQQSLAEANEMFRLAGLRYEEGHIDFLNYLDQLLASLDSRTRYYQGLYQLNQRINRLEKAIYGSLREEAFLQ